MRPKYTLLVIALFACLSFSNHVLADEAKVEAGFAAAEAWLSIVDQGQYEKSWDEATSYFRDAIDKSDWVKTIKAVRTHMGNVIKRERGEGEYSTTLPSAPDGEYVTMEFKTSFENKKEGIETVYVRWEADKRWRVAGYYIN